jgi:hypothetical protein
MCKGHMPSTSLCALSRGDLRFVGARSVESTGRISPCGVHIKDWRFSHGTDDESPIRCSMSSRNMETLS